MLSEAWKLRLIQLLGDQLQLLLEQVNQRGRNSGGRISVSAGFALATFPVATASTSTSVSPVKVVNLAKG